MKRRRIFLLNDQTAPRINAELACEIGLNESIILLQFEFWQSISDHLYDDKVWFFKSIPEIRQTFRFWSADTVKRAIAAIVKQKFVFTGNFNKSKFDKTTWYSLNFKELAKLKSIRIDGFSDECNLHLSKENAMISDGGKLHSSTIAICTDGRGQFAPMGEGNLHPSPIREYTENTDRQTDMPLSGFPDTAENEVGRSVSQSVSSESLFSMCKRQSKGVMTLIKSGIKKHGVKYVKSQIEYCNVKCRNLRAYRFLLSDAINGDFAEGWKDDEIFSETLDSQQKEKKRSESEAAKAKLIAEKAETERQKQKELEVSDFISRLPADRMEALKSEFVNVMPEIIRRSWKKQGWNSLSVKIHFEKYVQNQMEVA